MGTRSKVTPSSTVHSNWPLPWVSGAASLLMLLSIGSACASDPDADDEGVGGQGAPFNELPSCLIELFASCGTNSACTVQSADAGLAAQSCYASGARANSSIAGRRSEVAVTKPDGSLCFTYVSNLGPSGENALMTWTNGAGETVATGNYGYGIGYGERIECTGSGVVTSCSNPCRPRSRVSRNTTSCSEGSCP